MLIQFRDDNGSPYSGSANIGIANGIIVQLFIDPEGGTDKIVGDLFRNTTKIGEFIWSTATGSVVNYYTGAGRGIYVSNGDVLSAKTSAPTVTEVKLTIIRTNPTITDTAALPVNVNEIEPMVSSLTSKLRYRRIKDTITLIQSFATVKYSNSAQVNIDTIRSYLNNTAQLPAVEANVYSNAEDLNKGLATVKPPTPKEIFDSWDRFSGNDYYTQANPAPSTSEASYWAWDESKKSAVMPVNSATRLGFVSKDLVDFYDHEATVVSDDGDDDWNGLIMAFTRVNGVNYYLHATACCDGQSNTSLPIADNFFIRYNWNPSLVTRSVNSYNNGWRGRFRRIKVSRRGDQFNVQASKWNTLDYDPTLAMSINLNDDVNLAKFKGPTKYGYFNYSQAKSYFKDIRYYGGIMNDTIVDAANNVVYRYDPDTGWAIVPGLTAATVFGKPRVLVNPTDGKRYQIGLDGGIKLIS